MLMWMRLEWVEKSHPHAHEDSDGITGLAGTLEIPGSVSHASGNCGKNNKDFSLRWTWRLLVVWPSACDHKLSWWGYNQFLWGPLWGLNEAKRPCKAVGWARTQQPMETASTFKPQSLPENWHGRRSHSASHLTKPYLLLPQQAFPSLSIEQFFLWFSQHLPPCGFNYWLWLCLLEQETRNLWGTESLTADFIFWDQRGNPSMGQLQVYTAMPNW